MTQEKLLKKEKLNGFSIKISKKLNHSILLKLLVYIPLFIILFIVMTLYQPIAELGGRLFEPVSLKTFLDALTTPEIYTFLPYLFVLLFVPFAGIFYAFNRRISVVQVISFYLAIICMWLVAYAIYIVFPTTASEVMITSYDEYAAYYLIHEGAFQTLQNLYGSSTPLGDFPSLHVAPLMLMGIFLRKHWKTLFWIFLPIAFIGATGTYLLKFHTVIGFLGGVALGYFGYYVLYEKVVHKYLSKFFIEKESLS